MRWWRRRSQVERFDLYTRSSLYTLTLLAPFMIVSSFAREQPARPVPAVGVVVASVIQAGLAAVLIRVVLGRRRDGGAQPFGLLVTLAVVTLVGIGLSASQLGDVRANAGIAIAFFIVALVGTLSLVMRPRYAALVLLGAVVVLGAIDVLRPGGAPRTLATSVFATVTLLAGISAIGGYRASLWMLDVVWELDRARSVQARLAVAEERLRFARDLHDVVGRGLSVVSLKSDLAAQLAKRGRPEAADEMLEVRRVAQEMLADVRDVVRGYRATDLGAELAGARSVLRSAGIDCHIIGSTDGLGEPAQSTLAWVVREGTTNVLRHSQATRCTIAVRAAEDGAIHLTMENDGSSGDEPVVLGHGLLGLTERVAAGGGVIRTERRSGVFRLIAELPS